MVYPKENIAAMSLKNIKCGIFLLIFEAYNRGLTCAVWPSGESRTQRFVGVELWIKLKKEKTAQTGGRMESQSISCEKGQMKNNIWLYVMSLENSCDGTGDKIKEVKEIGHHATIGWAKQNRVYVREWYEVCKKMSRMKEN